MSCWRCSDGLVVAKGSGYPGPLGGDVCDQCCCQRCLKPRGPRTVVVVDYELTELKICRPCRDVLERDELVLMAIDTNFDWPVTG